MYWINKNSHYRRLGHHITNSFIKEAWSDVDNKYVCCTFDDFKRDRRMERVLHREQHGFCCYCMRKIEVGKHTTVEHVMPNNCTTPSGDTDWEKVSYYKHYNKNFKKKVAYVHLDGVDRIWKSGAPYPHFCAYDNLTLSCDGSLFTDEDKQKDLYPSQLHLCCNNPRGDAKIIPLFFIRHIGKLISYDGKDGVITFKTKSTEFQKKLTDAIDALKLDHDRLQIIRRSWYRIAKCGIYSIQDVKTAIHDENLRKEIIMDSGITPDDFKRIKNPIYWELLSEYYWFFKYFKNIPKAKE